MSASTVAPRRTVWPTVARTVAWVALIAALVALVFLVYVWPWLLAFLAAGAALGALPWLFRRFGKLRAGLIVAFGLFVVLVTIGSVSGGPQHAGGPNSGPGAQPARYFAEYTYVSTGDWSGMEHFDFKRDQALNFTGRGRGRLADRIAKAVPPDWTVKPLGTSGFRVEHRVGSQPFEIPKRKPMTVTAHVRVPELDARAPRLPVFADAGSTVLLHAPATRIHATKPASSSQPEDTKTSVREIKLTGAQERPVVTVEIKATLPASSRTRGLRPPSSASWPRSSPL